MNFQVHQREERRDLDLQTKKSSGFVDITGEEFNGCEALYYLRTKNKRAIWKFECFCGNHFEAAGTYLRNGHKKSCGCLKGRVTAERNYIHGKTGSRLFTIWSNMKSRCYNPNNAAYENYGGRGIVVSEKWLADFQEFEKWALSSGYKDNLSIDRIDNDKGYFPENCRWADDYIQGRNKRNTIFSFYKGKMRSRSEIAEMTGIPYEKVRLLEKYGARFGSTDS